MSYSYEYPRPMVTVDAIVYRKTAGQNTEILLIKRKKEPFREMWALPGGFVDMDEDIDDAVKRETKEETGVLIEDFKQFKAFGKPGRDPRGRNIAIVFYAELINFQKEIAGDDADDAKWFNIISLPKLAFDHEEIIEKWTNEILSIL